MVVRICRMVASISSTWSLKRSAAVPGPRAAQTLWMLSPAANRRCTTWSWRSRAIRSRSSSVEVRARTRRASARSRASAAWLASDAATSRSNSVNASASWLRTTKRLPRTPDSCGRGTAIAGPREWRASITGPPEAPMSSTSCGLPVSRHLETRVPGGSTMPSTASSLVARGAIDDELGFGTEIALRQHHGHQIRAREVEHGLGDQLQRIDVVVGEQLVRDPAGRRGPLLAPLALLEQPRVRDGHPGRRSQSLDQLLVIGREGIHPRVGEVQVAEDLVPDLERDAQEAVQLRVVHRAPDRARVGAHDGQADRLGVGDERAQKTEPLRRRPDRRHGLDVHADVDELVERAVRAQHPDGAVLGAHQLECCLDDLAQHRG